MKIKSCVRGAEISSKEWDREGDQFEKEKSAMAQYDVRNRWAVEYEERSKALVQFKGRTYGAYANFMTENSNPILIL